MKRGGPLPFLANWLNCHVTFRSPIPCNRSTFYRTPPRHKKDIVHASLPSFVSTQRTKRAASDLTISTSLTPPPFPLQLRRSFVSLSTRWQLLNPWRRLTGWSGYARLRATLGGSEIAHEFETNWGKRASVFEGVGEGEEAREENGWVGGRGERSKIGECLSFGIYSVQWREGRRGEENWEKDREGLEDWTMQSWSKDVQWDEIFCIIKGRKGRWDFVLSLIFFEKNNWIEWIG